MDKNIEQELKRAKAYADALKADNEQLRRQVGELQTENSQLQKSLKQAKDANPVQRPSIKRVMRLVSEAGMDVCRVAGGWILKFGKLTRRFRKLSQIWEIFTADNWYLFEVFPPVSEPQSPADARPRLPFRAPVLAAKAGVSTA